MSNKNQEIDFDKLCERLGKAYVKFLCALNTLEEEHDEVLSGGLNHADCKNHFLSNAYLSMFGKFELHKSWIFHSKAAKEQIESRQGKWFCGLCLNILFRNKNICSQNVKNWSKKKEMMRFNSVNEKRDSIFVQQFLEKYLSLGFGVLPKSEIDTLVFSLITDLGYIDSSMKENEIANELHITETKLSALRLAANARAKKPQSVEESIAELKTRISNGSIKIYLQKDNKNVLLSVPYPHIKKNLANAAEDITGYPADNYLNSRKVEMPISVFCAVLYKNDEAARNEFIKAAKRDVKFAAKIDEITKSGKTTLEIVEYILGAVSNLVGISQLFPAFGIKFP